MEHLVGGAIKELGAYEAWQLPLTLAMTLLAVVIVSRPFKLAKTLERWFVRIGERPFLAIMIILAIAIGAPVALSPFIGTQDPVTPDEFSLILQAKTFLAGHLANPISPTPNFETPYVLLTPTYSSIYPVLRSFPLILGYSLGLGASGGVLLIMAALAVAVFWMISLWLGAGYGFVAALIVVLRFGLFSMWVNSYWGGAFTALGGVLVLGAFKSLKSRPTVWAASALGAGAVILLTTRPYESLFYAAPIALALALHFLRSNGAVRKALAFPAVVSTALVLGGLSLSFAYNKAVTGDWKVPTYTQYQLATGTVHPFLFQIPVDSSQSTVRYDVNKRLFAHDYQAVERGRNLENIVSFESVRVRYYWNFYVGFALLVPFIIGIWALRREPAVLLSGASLAFALSIGTWNWAHYASPGFGIVILAVMLGFRDLREWRPWRRPLGLALSRTLPFALLIGTVVPLGSVILGASAFPASVAVPTHAPCCWFPARSLHIAVQNEIESSEGRNIVVTDTGPKAPVSEILISNEPNIEDARTIWINDDPDFNNSTLSRYAGRRVWRLGWLDDGSPCLQLFQAISSQGGDPLSGSFTSLMGDPKRGWFPAPADQCPKGITRVAWTVSLKR